MKNKHMADIGRKGGLVRSEAKKKAAKARAKRYISCRTIDDEVHAAMKKAGKI